MSHHGPTNPIYTGKDPKLRAAWLSGYNAGYNKGIKRNEVNRLERKVSNLLTENANLRQMRPSLPPF